MTRAVTSFRDRVPKRNAAAWIRRLPLLPALVFTIIVSQLPFVATLFISVFDWRATRPDKRGFIGLNNYIDVASDPRMLGAVVNSVMDTVSVVLICLVLGLGISLLLNCKFFGRGIVRTLLIAPFLIVPVAAALVFKHVIFSFSSGLLNGILTLVWGWFGSTHAPQFSLIVEYPLLAIQLVLIWQWTPFMILILLAGLQSLPQESVEAAKVDGAGPWITFYAIVLPHLRPYLELGALLGTIYIVQNFDVTRTMAEGSLGTANLPFLIYQTFSAGANYGLASAQGVITVVGATIVATFALRTVSGLLANEAKI